MGKNPITVSQLIQVHIQVPFLGRVRRPQNTLIFIFGLKNILFLPALYLNSPRIASQLNLTLCKLIKTNQYIVVTAALNIYRTILPVIMKMNKIAHYYRNQSQYHIYSHSFAHENLHMGVIHQTIIRIMLQMMITKLMTLNSMLICRVWSLINQMKNKLPSK